MACSLLSAIHKDSHQWSICVVVSRMWHFRGGTDDGPIKHTDLVLLDSEGNHMYGQIPTGTVDRLKDVLEEGKVYVIKKFLCNMSRPSFRPVESPFMVQFTRYTVVEAKPGLEDTFPFCTYSLTAFGDIPRPTVTPARFIDVIGRITMVSDVIPVQSMYQTSPSNTRTIMLTDLSGNELRLVLWGDRAVEFDAEAVRAMGATEPVIAIFVGMLPKTAYGVRGLSGSSACRWYVDEDIADINSFRSSLGDKFTPLAAYVPTGPDALRPRVQEDPVDKTVKELAELDPFVDMDKRFFCTVQVTRIGAEQRWWFPSCGGCRKSAKHTGYQYKCSDDDCHSVEADLTYCVSVFASDGTSEAEFVLFDKVATGALGKTLMSLLRQRYPGYATMDEIANVARHDTAIPPEITRLVGQKYKLLVTISKKWKLKNSENLSFQISRIKEIYKPELPPSIADVASGSGGLVSPGGISGSKLPALGPVMSPVTRTPPTTPASSIAKFSPATPAAGVPTAHKRGTRRTLFAGSPKEKSPATVKTADVLPATNDAEVATASKRQETLAPKENEEVTTEPDDNDTLPLKIRRTHPGGKGAGLNKKAKS